MRSYEEYETLKREFWANRDPVESLRSYEAAMLSKAAARRSRTTEHQIEYDRADPFDPHWQIRCECGWWGSRITYPSAEQSQSRVAEHEAHMAATDAPV